MVPLRNARLVSPNLQVVRGHSATRNCQHTSAPATRPFPHSHCRIARKPNRLEPVVPGSSNALRMPREPPYAWIRQLVGSNNTARLNALLNFVDYQGPPLSNAAEAVEVLLDTTNENVYRRRLQRCANVGMKEEFVRLVNQGRRYTPGLGTPYIYHIRLPDTFTSTSAPIAVGQPVPAPSTPSKPSSASASSLFVPPKAKDCAPPKPTLLPHPGPAPVKPYGKRYAWVHPFSDEEVTQYDRLNPNETISTIIGYRHSNWAGEPEHVRSTQCMWQIAAALSSPCKARDRVHDWICRIQRHLQWDGHRPGIPPSAKSIQEQYTFMKLALDYNTDIFGTLRNCLPFSTVHAYDAITSEQYTEYCNAVHSFNAAHKAHFESKKALDDWMLRWHVPSAPPTDECTEVAPPKGTTWEERDMEARKRAILIASDDEEETDKGSEVATKKPKTIGLTMKAV